MTTAPEMKAQVEDQQRPDLAALTPREMQELWFATIRHEWRSLVVVPASPGFSVLPIARALADVGGAIRGSPLLVLRAEGTDLNKIALLVSHLTNDASRVGSAAPRSARPRSADAEKAMIIAIDAVVTNPLVLPVALAADAVLVCVALGETPLESARHTVELIGRDRVIGSVLLRKP
jgi:hypothetical protein